MPYNKIRNDCKKLHSPDTIIEQYAFMHNNLPYKFQLHKAKLQLLFNNPKYNNRFSSIKKLQHPITQYLEKIPTSKIPHRIFKHNKNIDNNKIKEQRASQLKLKTLNFTKFTKNNLANKLASLAINLAKSNKERHQAIQNFFLINDSTTIAAEIPVYLTNDDIKYFQKRNFTLNLKNYETPITGHIDLLQVRNGLIHILDYKPEAEKINAVEQLTIYALALASRTKLALKDFKCAWFDENCACLHTSVLGCFQHPETTQLKAVSGELRSPNTLFYGNVKDENNYFEFFPLHAVYAKKENDQKMVNKLEIRDKIYA